MKKDNIKVLLILSVIIVIVLFCAKFLLSLILFILKWAIILGVAAAVIYFVYRLIKTKYNKPTRNLK